MNDYEKYLPILYKLALKSLKSGDIPVGSIVILNGKIIGKGFNNKERDNNVCGHAEINAIKSASKKIHSWRLNDCILLSTLKPCELCKEVIKASRIDKVYYLMNQNVNYKNNYQQLIYNDNYYQQYKKIFNDFFVNIRK